MTLLEVRKFYVKELASFYPENEILSMFYWLIHDFWNMSKSSFIVSQNSHIEDRFIPIFQDIIERQKKFEPIQYILGYAEFCDLKIGCNSCALIPRPETEELVHWISSSHDVNGINLLDIGTGTGCIALALKCQNQTWIVSAFDCSEKALELAKKNGESNEISVNFYLDDVCNQDKRKQNDFTFNIIVSNPPYIPNEETATMHSLVKEYEPHMALFVPNEDSLVFYRSIIEFALDHLMEGGYLYFEIHEMKALEVIKLLESHSFTNIELRKDLQGKDRMIRAQKLIL